MATAVLMGFVSTGVSATEYLNEDWTTAASTVVRWLFPSSLLQSNLGG